MKVPFSWLKEYVDIDVSAPVLMEKLFSCGFEVEALEDLGKDVENVVVCKIETCEKHPDADRLTVCTVDCGERGKRQIVTAATNVFPGARVPVALDGATVREGEGSRKIKSGKLRGVLSEGMFCSGEELGIGDDFYPGASFDGILILAEDAPLGADIRPVVGIDDCIFDIAVTANRPDCQSVYGIAREVAALLKKPLRELECGYHVRRSPVRFAVTVENFRLCPRYLGHLVTGVKVAPSPQWMRRRLSMLGIRPISNIVDVTNYVLLEVGQPMHAFDYEKLASDEIVVRPAREGETVTTLDEKQFTLTRNDLLICAKYRPVALAGIMGGLESSISPDTSAVLFEAASFARDCVRKTSRALGQRSDSSARFEKGVDAYYSPYTGLARALHLVEELGCGTVTDCSASAGPACVEQRAFPVKYSDLDAILGIHVPKEEVLSILSRLGFAPEEFPAPMSVTDPSETQNRAPMSEIGKTENGAPMSEDGFFVHVPFWRMDVDGAADIAEEVIRMYGYGHLTPTFLGRAAVTHGGLNAEQHAERHIKDVLAREGFFEAYGYSFYSPKDLDLFRFPADAPERYALRVANPIGEDLSLMRTVLAPTMLANIVRNVRRGNDSGRLFEFANVFFPAEPEPLERKHISLGLWGSGDFFDLKGAFEAVAEAFGLTFAFERSEKPFLHPGITARVLLKDKKKGELVEVGWLGELHPAIAEELALEKKAILGELDYDAVKPYFRTTFTYDPVPAFPAVSRDLALVVGEEVTSAALTEAILRACRAATKAELFDVYRDARLGAGKKSMAVRITFAPPADKPLSPETVDGYVKKILSALSSTLSATLR